MLLSYRRALERRIRSSPQTRQKSRPMDVHVHVTVLRLHSEYLTQLFTEVSSQLSTLEKTISEGHALTAVDPRGLLDTVAALQSRLCTEGEMFCQRLRLFVEGTKTAHNSTEQRSQQHPAELPS